MQLSEVGISISSSRKEKVVVTLICPLIFHLRSQPNYLDLHYIFLAPGDFRVFACFDKKNERAFLAISPPIPPGTNETNQRGKAPPDANENLSVSTFHITTLVRLPSASHGRQDRPCRHRRVAYCVPGQLLIRKLPTTVIAHLSSFGHPFRSLATPPAARHANC